MKQVFYSIISGTKELSLTSLEHLKMQQIVDTLIPWHLHADAISGSGYILGGSN